MCNYRVPRSQQHPQPKHSFFDQNPREYLLKRHRRLRIYIPIALAAKRTAVQATDVTINRQHTVYLGSACVASARVNWAAYPIRSASNCNNSYSVAEINGKPCHLKRISTSLSHLQQHRQRRGHVHSAKSHTNIKFRYLGTTKYITAQPLTLNTRIVHTVWQNIP